MENIILLLIIFLIIEVTYIIYTQTVRVGTRKGSQKPVFIDTSVLIDGRIMGIVKAGFLSNEKLYVPRSVVRELQFMADNSDTEKRLKARRGLDNLAELQSDSNLNIEIYQDKFEVKEGVDERLINLAKKHAGAVCTLDFNLIKVASVEDVLVLNINDLAMNLRMSYLPGDKFMVELNQKGSEGTQAIGHLDDGTMVVVENARKFIGSSLEVETVRSLQTSAGRMIFARIIETPKTKFNKKHKQSSQSSKNKSFNKSSEDRLVNLANH